MIWLPLTGKKCLEPGWNTIGYKGVDPDTYEGDLGLRLDSYVVVDCDSQEAAEAWLRHIGENKLSHTTTRKTPNGYHFFYHRGVDSYGIHLGKVPSIHPLIDIKAGMGHQVRCRAEGYCGLVSVEPLTPFNPAWVPAASQAEWQGDEWSEMPDGMGDNAMIAFAGTFRRWGMDEARIRECLGAINLLTMTRQPMSLSRIKRLAKQAAKWSPEEAKTVLCPGCGAEVETR